jgi:MFS family permease
MIIGVLVMAVVSGHLISRTGKYKLVLIVGMALTTLGLFLCSRLDGSTGTRSVGLALGVLGCGLGLVVQVPIIAVQNAVAYRDLGVATSGVTLARAVGGLTGITIFSATLGHHLTARMAEAARAVERLPGLDVVALQRDPTLLSDLPPAVRAPFTEAFEHSFQAMFLWSIPVALAGLALALLLQGAAVRATANVSDLGESFGGAPTVRSSRREIERQLCELLRSDAKTTEKVKQTYTDLGALAGSDCPPGSLWALCRVARSRSGTIPATALSGREGVTAEDGRPFINRLVAGGLVIRDNGNIAITEEGRALMERLCEARHRALLALLDGWAAEDFPDLVDRLARLSRQFLGDDADQPILKRKSAM